MHHVGAFDWCNVCKNSYISGACNVRASQIGWHNSCSDISGRLSSLNRLFQ